MREQQIKRIVDSLDGQGRMIVNLTCGHNPSITLREIQADPTVMEDLRRAERTGKYMCPFCEDPPPPEKTPSQLWREAGEP